VKKKDKRKKKKSIVSKNFDSFFFCLFSYLEATGGFEPPHKGFADLSLSHLGTSPSLKIKRARDGARTRDPNLGKVVLYQLSYSRFYTSL
jgi:hypothetical protein